MLPLPALASTSSTAPAVLVLHSNQRVTPAAIVIENTLRKVVPEKLAQRVDFYSEYLDIEWATTDEASAAQAEFLRQKYRERKVRAIVASAPQALQFVLRFRDRMLPGVPVVHIAVARDQLPAALPPDIVGRTVDLDPLATFRLAMHLQPQARRLVVVVGAAERDRLYERRVRSALEQLEGGVNVEFLSGLPTAEVVRRLGALAQDTIVYTPGYFVDGAGDVMTPRQSAERIVPASAAPVYAPLDTFLDTGIVGGYMLPYEHQATHASAVLARLLNGESPETIGTSSVPSVPVVDWRAVRRWGLDERALPAETLVRFRNPTPWETYAREISAGIALVLLQAVLITALLVERRSRRRIAGALQDSKERIDLAARAARLSMWDWDVGRGRFWTTASSRSVDGIANRTPQDLDEFLDSVHVADRDQVRRAVREAVEGNQELDVEFRMHAADGEVRWIAARGRADPGGHRRLMGVTQDITERKAAELQAERDRNALTHMSRVSMVGQVSASIAHQLNQPLTAILGNAEAARKLLDRPHVDLAELREICDDIVAEDNRAAEVIRRLGALFKRGEMTLSPLDLNALVRDTVDLLRAEMATRHVSLTTELADALPMIEGGRVHLQQVFLNLMLNAADAMAASPENARHIVVRTDASEGEVRACIVDRGPGVAADNLRTIFDPFWSTKPGGMGMGLAICQSIVTAHRGRLTAVNNPAGGATFCAVFPVAAA